MQFVPPFEIDPDAPDTGAESGDIAKALATLVEEQRAGVMSEALNYREVAEMQSVPIGTVMSRLARARAHAGAVLEGMQCHG